MSAEIHRIRPEVEAPSQESHVQPDVVKMLENLLTAAQEGKIQALGFAIVFNDWSTGHAIVGSSSNLSHQQSAAISDLAFSMSALRAVRGVQVEKKDL